MVEKVRAAYRGGTFNNGAVAGVFFLYLVNAPSNANYNIGFRACKVKDCEPDGRALKNRGCRARVALES